LVDDDRTHRDLVRELLEPLGFTVVTAANGTECLAVAGESRPDLILLDISMPDIDGWEVARQLRLSLEERPAIVMLSAITLEKERDVAPDRAHDDYMIKPISLRHLLEKFQTLLDLKWTTRSDEADDAAPPAQSAKPDFLPVEELDHLIKLGQIGHYGGIRARLKEIDRDTPEFAASTAELRTVLGSFNLDRLLVVLEAQRKSHAR
jgi:CheY-like chemotaxis protein